MDRQKTMKCAYLAPFTEVIPVNVEYSLLVSSPVSGGHNDAGDGEELNAKRNRFFDHEDEVGTNGWRAWS
ncbi:hypothetical protein Prede_0828 [Prevotella dentalis DSM 3688]|uniref:Uncharacterized protein n=1 Tax=Prevotella dentalis (strain ATCC 49559 / DSM 3688 / JCM 13448 / NCTC 12043 / ES 2772) TaxID=908937 RepID=F9D1F7_PREDD|nr:hypothetical protein [Prevotella dentalis]AGB28172.1 hypothetical protein Prede_0828 [Prevotella dentalis DSM 3688]EGQ16205.1 hypothetical protein HMPREF9136_0685 [Prevotella dentalis DSM 3688]